MTSSTTAPARDAAADRAAIGAAPVNLVKAWAAQDADAFAALFLEDGTMMLPGVYRKGRAEIRDFMAGAFSTVYKGTQVTGTPLEMKPLGPDAVALITEGGVIAAGETQLSAAAAIRASWILVRSGDQWLLSVYQNCPRDPAS